MLRAVTDSLGKTEAYIASTIAGTKTIKVTAEKYVDAFILKREGITRIFFIPQVTPVITQARRAVLSFKGSMQKTMDILKELI